MKNNNLFLLRIFTFCCFLLFVTSCTNKKNTAMHRGWHNMNARYNGYFYSRENIKESVKKVEKSNKDDFTKLLPLFIYTDNINAKNYYSDFDKTIKKSSVVIQRHAIINPKTKEEIPNACRWIDENYMLIGQSHFYKRDFFSALEMFEYVSKKYPNPEAKYGAMLWMIRTNNEIGSFSKTEAVFDEIRSAEDFPQDKFYQRELAAVTADYNIKKNDYPRAIVQLEKAIELTRKKMVKARYTFVLAQLYEKLGDNSKASKYYETIPAMHPNYDMEFTARINHAKLYDAQSGDTKVIKRQLMRMLKDAKNLEFRDQIYYALAEIAYKEKDIPLAFTYLDNSIKESVSNNTQKALSYLKRADIHFEKMNYKPASANYDSTIAFLPKDYPDYNIIESKKKSLDALVLNLNIISLEDSLQQMAKMPEKDRNEAVEKMISKIEEEELAKKEEQLNQAKNPDPIPQNQTTTTAQTQTGNAWYFYNPSTVSFGVGEFNKKWGGRKLEDNWRRSEKSQEMVTTVEKEEEEGGVDSVANAEANVLAENKEEPNVKKDKNYYLKKIPLTPEALAKSNGRILEAYYNVGSIYKEQLFNNVKSVETFEEMLKRYPDNNKYKLPSYYHLYRTYLSMNNAAKAEYYKGILLRDFPDSEYAKIIKDPEYAKDVMASRSQVEQFYAETYQLYSEGKYTEALAKCEKASRSYSKSYLMPQFDFVKALCIGRTQDLNAFEKALTQVVIKYPKEPVKEKAQEMIDAIKKQRTLPAAVVDTTHNTAAPVLADTTTAKPKFIFKEGGEYYWVTAVVNGKGDIAKFKTKLSDINDESFGMEELNISTVFLDLVHQLVSVKSFDGKEEAMKYYNFFKDNKDAFADLEPGTFQSFIISSENYTVFYKDKNIQEYQQFFTQNYK
ncbi:MAG: tetratricopeptide repeat protein [Bacteroidota bacterium]